MTRYVLSAVAALALAGPAWAELQPVRDKSKFMQIVQGKTLSRPFVTLQVSGNGQISGKGATRPVTGSWRWDGGFFCRDLNWGDRALGYNCQEVRVNGDTIRFTSDKGAGDSADFRLR